MIATLCGFLGQGVGTQSLHCIFTSGSCCHFTDVLGTNCSISNFNRNLYITEGSPWRRFKGSRKGFRGHEVALINYFYCIHNILVSRGNSNDNINPVYIAWLKKRGTHGGFMWPRRSSGGPMWFLNSSYLISQKYKTGFHSAWPLHHGRPS